MDPLVPGGGTDAAVDATSGSAPRPPVRELAAGDVFTALNTSRRGLSAERARAGWSGYGAKEMPRTRRRPVWRQLGAQFTDLFAVVLVVASVITFLAYGLQEPRDVGTLQLAVAILGVVVLNAAIGFAREYSAERTAQALEAMVPHACRVLRDGRRLEVPARDRCRAMWWCWRPGTPCRRTAGRSELTVNNASLTGESNAVGRTTDQVAAGPPLDARNCVFMGTDVVAGSGRAVVYATAATAEFGRIRRSGSDPVTRSCSSRTTRTSRRSTPRSSERSSPPGPPSAAVRRPHARTAPGRGRPGRAPPAGAESSGAAGHGPGAGY
ncbi:P-type ATPase [Streptomyces pseudovenezuelae]|uniref:P-type ATPase n=1 Tax=Streptomyces pseudovenezuelae TaxID=67350 RepID=UPI0036ED3EE2